MSAFQEQRLTFWAALALNSVCVEDLFLEPEAE